MFKDNLEELYRNKDKFEDLVADSFGQSISEHCYDPLVVQFQTIKQAHDTSETEVNMIRTLLSTLRTML